MTEHPQRPPFAGWLSTTNDITRTFLAASRVPGLINMAGGLPEPATFPVAEIADIAAAVVRGHAGEVLGYGPVEGLPELRDALDLPCLVICGGAIVDFLGGRVRRAPGWLRRLGLEWLWRLAQEPRRLFMRYVVGNPMFLWRSARLSRQMRSVRPTLR